LTHWPFGTIEFKTQEITYILNIYRNLLCLLTVANSIVSVQSDKSGFMVMVSVSARLCGADAAISNTHFLILNINSDFILIRTSTTASMLSVYHWSESRWQFVRRALPFPS